MKVFNGSIYTHLSLQSGHKMEEIQKVYREFEEKSIRLGVLAVGSDDGLLVNSYRDLVQNVASIAYENSRLVLMYRGQGVDFRESGKGKRSSIYPTIYRDQWNHYKLSSETRPEYFERLSTLVRKLRPKVFRDAPETGDDSKNGSLFASLIQSKKYEEQMWALIQHYELFPTPMIDVTQSLQVACSFALSSTKDGRAFVYVFGMPSIGGSISYSVDDETCIARLQTVCPPRAIRAHFQEGLLVSNFPESRRREDGCNLANRLLAKFIINGESFWSDGFQALDSQSLLPKADPFADELKEMQREVYPELYDGLETIDTMKLS